MARQKSDVLKLWLTAAGVVACIIFVARARFVENDQRNKKLKETASKQAYNRLEEEYKKALQESNKLDAEMNQALGGQNEKTHVTTLPATREDVIILDRTGRPLTRATWER